MYSYEVCVSSKCEVRDDSCETDLAERLAGSISAYIIIGFHGIKFKNWVREEWMIRLSLHGCSYT